MKVDVLLGLQWGDEGKGKIVDVLTPQYDIIARFQGGPNAGHTLIFDGKKHVVLSTTKWLGGKNDFLGIAYITVGAVCLALAIAFAIKHATSPRKIGDTQWLVWHKERRAAQ